MRDLKSLDLKIIRVQVSLSALFSHSSVGIERMTVNHDVVGSNPTGRVLVY